MVFISSARRSRPECRARARAVLACAAGALLAAPAHASPPPLSVPISTDQSDVNGPRDLSGFLGNLQRSNFLLGDLFGLRTALSPYGISIALQETSEVIGNASGGVRQGAAYEGLTQAVLQLDTQRAFGWYGGLFDISALQIHGRNLSSDNLLSLQTASGIEADRATRLWEFWYDQKFLPDDRLDIKLGQQSIDQEFIVNTNGGYFVNTMFGWPVVPSYDLPGGGPAYPLSTPGIRFRYRPINPVAILVGVFNGSPANNNVGDAQQVNNSGTNFPLNQGPLVIAELQYTLPRAGQHGGARRGRAARPHLSPRRLVRRRGVRRRAARRQRHPRWPRRAAASRSSTTAIIPFMRWRTRWSGGTRPTPRIRSACSAGRWARRRATATWSTTASTAA